ncbi:MAG TPA: hypothetical protein VEC57_21080, partial [Candidatus Limnocylindrales bacterium]|nr:hypothetical protein [Candidatus Limnocylindrales bacterium]
AVDIRTTGAGNDITIAVSSTTNDALVLNSGGAITVNDTVTLTANSMDVDAVGNITDGGTGVLATAAGDLDLRSTTGTIGVDATNALNVSVAGGNLVLRTDAAAGAGDIFITSAANLSVGAITSGTGSDAVDIRTTGGATLTITNATETLTGDAVVLDSGTGTLTIADTAFDVAAGSLSLTGDEINLTGGDDSIRGNGGTILLRPSTTSLDIRIGAAADSGAPLDLIASDITAIQNGFTSITIGRSTDGTGAVSIDGTVTFSDPTAIHGGSIVDTGFVVGTSAGNDLTLHARTGAIGTSVADPLNVNVGGNLVLVTDAAAGAADIFVTSAADLSVGSITTGAGTDAVDIRTTGAGNDITIAVSSTTNDALVLNSGGAITVNDTVTLTANSM